MTEQQIRFADKYFETLNGYQSAVFAGYSEESARQTASRLLQDKGVEAYLSEIRSQYQVKTGISKDRVLDEYRKIAFSDIRNICTVDGGLKDLSELDDEVAGAIASIESMEVERDGEKMGTNRKIKLHDKLRALEALSKHLGLFKEDNDQKRPDFSGATINFK